MHLFSITGIITTILTSLTFSHIKILLGTTLTLTFANVPYSSNPPNVWEQHLPTQI